MPLFAAYDIATGQILRLCSNDLGTAEGQGFMPVKPDMVETDATHYVRGGAMFEYPVQPSEETTFDYETGTWLDKRSETDIAQEAAALLSATRAKMRCSPLQGRLTLGAEICARLDAFAADPETNWAMRETILNASEWQRGSQTMDELAYALGFTPAQTDALFTIAMAVKV